jgi:hypothetical protein
MLVVKLEWRLMRKRVASLKPSPENERLYDRSNADIREFAARIEAEGLLEPLVVTADNYIVSGHRRHAALTLLGRVLVDCRVLQLRRSDLTTDEYIALLRCHNRQRDKNVTEKIRETLVDIDADDAWANLCDLRDKSVNAAHHNGVCAVAIEGRKKRYGISEDKAEHVKYVLQVLEERRPYWPLSVRGVHYPLLNFKFVRGQYYPRRKDPDYGGPARTLSYQNDQGSYDATVDLLTRLRLNGTVPWEALHDPTRPKEMPRPFANVQAFIRQEAERLFDGYWRDLLQTQPNYVACLVEKNTVYHMALQVTSKYQVPTFSARGLDSIDSFHDIAEHYRASGKAGFILVVLSDYDPEGEFIPHDAGRRFRDDFGIADPFIVKAGVTRQLTYPAGPGSCQVERYGLQPMNFAKESSPHHAWFVQRNRGDDTVWELEALDPADMLADLDAVIRSVLDMDLFNREAAVEQEEAREIEATRRTVRDALRGLGG